MRYLLLLFLFLPQFLFADRIFFKIAVDDSHYSTFEFSEIENINKNLHFIFSRYQDLFFDINNAKKEFYNIRKKPDIKFNGKSVNVYELFSVLKDRFSQTLWLSENFVVRKEVYDLKGKLMYAYGHAADVPDKHNFEFSDETNVSRSDYSELTYKGFDVKYIKRLKNGAVHILYDDGVNTFSVFITVPAVMKEQVKRIILGNYVYSVNYDNATYTVVGTIPYNEMDNVIKFISNKKLDIKGGN